MMKTEIISENTSPPPPQQQQAYQQPTFVCSRGAQKCEVFVLR